MSEGLTFDLSAGVLLFNVRKSRTEPKAVTSASTGPIAYAAS